MPTEDTINLLKECDAGCKMGIDAIKQVIDKVENKKLYDIIVKYLNDHQKLQNKITDKLNAYGFDVIETRRMKDWVSMTAKMR